MSDDFAYHEMSNAAMEDGVIIVAIIAEFYEVLASFGDSVTVEL